MQAVVTGVYPFPLPVHASIFIAHRVQPFHCSSNLVGGRCLMLSSLPLLNLFIQGEAPTSMHSVRLDYTELI